MKIISTYTKIVLVALASIATLSLSVPAVEAKTVLRSGDSVSISEDQIVEGDFYTAGSKISISGEIKEDIVSAGGETTLNGLVGGDAFLVGGRVDVHSKIGDDLRILAGDVTIAESVAGDVLVIGGSVNILSTASVAGDVIIFGGEAVIEGPVAGDVLGFTGTLRIDSAVKGEVDVTVEQLTIGDNAKIDGGVRYVSDMVLVQSLNASIVGDVMRSDPQSSDEKSSRWNPVVVFSLVLIFSVLVWYLLSRKTLQMVVSRVTNNSRRSMLVGFAAVILVPIATSILIFSAVGSIVGFVTLLLYMAFLVLGMIASVPVFGALLLTTFKRSNPAAINLQSLFLGMVLFSLLMIMPMIGSLFIIICILITFGALIDLLIVGLIK